MTSTTEPAALPTRAFADAARFAAWLARNHGRSRGLWIKLAKKGAGARSITYQEAVEVALCWGWIDGQSRRIDDDWWVQKYTPRSRRSVWSKINCGRAEALIAAGKMQPPGLAEIQRARDDGRWGRAYDPPSRATVPEDLAAALKAKPRAQAFFAGLDSRNRYAVLYRVQAAKKPETRARRIAELVAMMATGRKLYP